jgi:hypothetical protein
MRVSEPSVFKGDLARNKSIVSSEGLKSTAKAWAYKMYTPLIRQTQLILHPNESRVIISCVRVVLKYV